MADLKEVVSKALSFLDSKGKTIVVKAEQEKALYSLLEGNADLEGLCKAAELKAGNLNAILKDPPHFIYASAEKVLEERFLRALKDFSSELHKRISLIVVDESHTVETWTGKRYFCALISRRRLQGKLPITE